ncbi:hypothetical protein [Primorskyibacter sp. S187A]|uniref:hypothetical protein n=1 Tax=Primorskyibacter sp. S187A TaxID=3415130 RepID=UPI003C7BB48A
MMKKTRFPARLLSCLSAFCMATTAVACELPAFERVGGPVFRDQIPSENYQAAADAHIFARPGGGYAMIYSGDDSGHSSIKMAVSDDRVNWRPAGTMVGPSAGHRAPIEKETSFYFRTASGEHQIYFIGYADGNTYESEIYMATSGSYNGPYTVRPEPIVRLGRMDGKPVKVITSPSIVEHNGVLHMAFLGWNGFHNVSAVWTFGTTSPDNGRSWENLREVNVPIGMEGQITRTPQGQYVAVATREHRGKEAIFAGCANHPFGPYQTLRQPILAQAGPPHETDEIIAPQLFYPPGASRPELFYTGAQYDTGWWIMKAR